MQQTTLWTTLATVFATAFCGPIRSEELAEQVTVGRQQIDPAAPPESLFLDPESGILADRHLTVQRVYRTKAPSVRLYETRALKTPGGDYLLMFPEGQHYAGKKTKVNEMLAFRSSDGGRTWTGPTRPFDIDYNQHGFIPFVPRGSERVYCFGTQPVWDRFSGLEDAPIGYRYSDDDGRSWSELHLIRPENAPDFMGMSVMRMCETDRGTWLLGSHTNAGWYKAPDGATSARTRQYLLRSEDRGRKWTLLPGPAPGGWRLPEHQGGRFEEGRPIYVGGGEALMMVRTFEGHLWTLRSSDDGRTWSEPEPTPLVHPCAPPMVFHLSDGETLVALHHNRWGNRKTHHRDRSEVWLSLSEDKGRTWSRPRFVFANALSEKTEKNIWLANNCSYIDLFCDGGKLHLFVPHRWRQALHLTIAEGNLERLSSSPGD